MKYKVWICVESCDEEYEQYEDVEVPFAEVATLETESEALTFASALQRYGVDILLDQT
jgi:peptide subunit release factor RF-3|tara:strand:- start:327 stop:500 length:174 start_codon:yes stop_codon:yes gene_type:complete